MVAGGGSHFFLVGRATSRSPVPSVNGLPPLCMWTTKLESGLFKKKGKGENGGGRNHLGEVWEELE